MLYIQASLTSISIALVFTNTLRALRGRIEPGDVTRSLHHVMKPRWLMLLTPFHHAVIASAFMQRIKVWPRCLPPSNPCVGNNAYIGVARELLPEHFDAVILKDDQISFRTKSLRLPLRLTNMGTEQFWRIGKRDKAALIVFRVRILAD